MAAAAGGGILSVYINTGAGEGKTNSPSREVKSGADSYVKRLFVEQSYILHSCNLQMICLFWIGAVVRREWFCLHLHIQGRYWQDAVTLGRIEMLP